MARSYTEDLKRWVVYLYTVYENSGKTQREIEHELGIGEGSISRWRKKYIAPGPPDSVKIQVTVESADATFQRADARSVACFTPNEARAVVAAHLNVPLAAVTFLGAGHDPNIAPEAVRLLVRLSGTAHLDTSAGNFTPYDLLSEPEREIWDTLVDRGVPVPDSLLCPPFWPGNVRVEVRWEDARRFTLGAARAEAATQLAVAPDDIALLQAARDPDSGPEAARLLVSVPKAAAPDTSALTVTSFAALSQHDRDTWRAFGEQGTARIQPAGYVSLQLTWPAKIEVLWESAGLFTLDDALAEVTTQLHVPPEDVTLLQAAWDPNVTLEAARLLVSVPRTAQPDISAPTATPLTELSQPAIATWRAIQAQGELRVLPDGFVNPQATWPAQFQIIWDTPGPFTLDDALAEAATRLNVPQHAITLLQAAWDPESDPNAVRLLVSVSQDAQPDTSAPEGILIPDVAPVLSLDEEARENWAALRAQGEVRTLPGEYVSPLLIWQQEIDRRRRHAERTTIPEQDTLTWHWDRYRRQLGERDWEEAALRYRQRVAESCGTTRILGSAVPTSVGECAIALYDLTSESARRNYRPDVPFKAADDPFYAQLKRIPDGVAWYKNGGPRHLHVLGAPGSGKTTYLKRLAWEAARDDWQSVPVYISLRAWSLSGSSLSDFIVQAFEGCGLDEQTAAFVNHLLGQENALLLLLDGVDEIIPPPPSNNGNANTSGELLWLEKVEQLHEFISAHPQPRYVLSGRCASETCAMPGFKYVAIADFDAEQEQRFIENWFCFDRRYHKPENTFKCDDFDVLWEEFNRPANHRVRSLVSSPLTLALLCLSVEEQLPLPVTLGGIRAATLNLPLDQQQLYAWGVSRLLEIWNPALETPYNRVYAQHPDKRKLFTDLAYDSTQRSPAGYPPAVLGSWLEKNIAGARDGEAVLKAIADQQGVLEPVIEDTYDFASPYLRDYLAATYLVNKNSPAQLEVLVEEAVTDRCCWDRILFAFAAVAPSARLAQALFDELERRRESQPGLKQLLTWAHRKAVNAQYGSNAATNRLTTLQLQVCYLWMALALDLAHRPGRRLAGVLDWVAALAGILERETLELAPALTLDGALAPYGPLEQALGAAYRLSPHFALDLLLGLTLDLTSTHRGMQLRTSHEGRRANFDRLWGQLLNMARQCGADSLVEGVVNIAEPPPGAPEEQWYDLERELRALSQQQRDIGHRWQFAGPQADRLADFFYGAALLAAGLKLVQLPSALVEQLLGQQGGGGGRRVTP